MRDQSRRLRFQQREQGDFYREVRAEAASHLAARHQGPHAPAEVWIKFAVLAAWSAGCYAAVLADALPDWLRLAAYAGFGVGAILLAVNVGHEAAHSALSRHAWVNTLVNRLTFMLVGVDGRMWSKRHLGSHHVYPNILGCDADIDASYLLRLSPHHPHRAYQRWQHVYAPLIYPLVQLHSIFVQDVVYLFKRRLANLSGLRPTGLQILEFAAIKAGHFAVALVIPAAATDLPFGHVLFAYLASGGLMSSLFILALVGTHFAEGNRFPAIDGAGTVPGSWAAHSVETSLDWSPEHRIATGIVGGLNAHAAHHLFPQVSHVHYPALTRIIRAAAARHGVRYRATNLSGMVAGHFRFLRALAQPSADARRLQQRERLANPAFSQASRS